MTVDFSGERIITKVDFVMVMKGTQKQMNKVPK